MGGGGADNHKYLIQFSTMFSYFLTRLGLLENFGDWKAELNTAGAASQKFLVRLDFEKMKSGTIFLQFNTSRDAK